MKKYVLLFLIIGLAFNACKNPNEKEIADVKALIVSVEDSEKFLFAVDTSKVFSFKRQMEKDLMNFNSIQDTLTKEEAFKVGDIFASKKRLFRLESNYPELIREIEFSKKQLNNLKQDLENQVMKKEDFKLNFATEKAAVKDLEGKINKSIQNIEVDLQKYELDREELLELIEKRKQRAAANE